MCLNSWSPAGDIVWESEPFLNGAMLEEMGLLLLAVSLSVTSGYSYHPPTTTTVGQKYVNKLIQLVPFSVCLYVYLRQNNSHPAKVYCVFSTLSNVPAFQVFDYNHSVEHGAVR